MLEGSWRKNYSSSLGLRYMGHLGVDLKILGSLSKVE